MLTSLIRTIVIFIVALIVVRLMGKRQIGEMQPFELVITLIIAEVACVPMSDPSIPMYYGVLPIVALFVLHYLLSFIARKSINFRKVIDGNAVVVITPDGVDLRALKRLNMNVNDLLESSRNAGYFNLEDILFGVFETNGKFSVIPRSDATEVTRKDLKIKAEESSIPCPLVIDGKFVNIETLAISKQQLETTLRKKGIKSVKNILLLTVDESGAAYVQPKSEKFYTVELGKNLFK